MKMIESEARGYVKGKLDCMKKCDVFNKEDKHKNGECEECEYCYSQGNFGEQKEAFQMAINALEKQEKIKEAFEMWKAETDGYYGADDETTKFIRTLTQILRSDEDIYNNYETNKLA